ncbi:Uncharacterised protein [Mycobacteroides abscessus]|uniref:hypothetical protein n=1 Tax=Mycobacteroides abscessus TaxID=36809 RepID=UPI0005E00C44|nr:hypothetical protein [Mycobacteroides abscessus]CPS10904.1 Uncharacterised protein [Mycobacteroides abscessus]CPS50571.1 Uncharacterised protein [Mycobacteroides abscessus]CPS93638.1 Uncharacterised protein [Mycobacteroides abscessus]CPS94322.1 Uncharacterised protein [Mycobacteroides abscessus]CPT61675.1 Uncharacterised protein [Mycobacteroides abscessus]
MTQTNNDTQWDLLGLTDPYPHLPAPTIAITPWTDDADLAEATADLVDVYPGADRDVLAELLQDLRAHLRQAVMASAVGDVADGLVDVVHAATTDAELGLIVAGAEAGRGVPIPGLLVALEDLRDGAAGRASAEAA